MKMIPLTYPYNIANPSEKEEMRQQIASLIRSHIKFETKRVGKNKWEILREKPSEKRVRFFKMPEGSTPVCKRKAPQKMTWAKPAL
jgi:hypothetical protein